MAHAPDHPTLPEQFTSKFFVNDDGCWIWTAATNPGNPYPVLQWRGKRKFAHRLSWEWANGEIPEGFHVHHCCGVMLCVNPDHLEAHSPEDHVEAHDRLWGGARINAEKTHCKRTHEFTDENTYVDPDGKRHCRACRALTARKFRARRKVAV